MRFPPPARYFVPLLVLLFGFTVVWLGYELNLANDLARNLSDVADHAASTGTRLAKICENRIAHGEMQSLGPELAGWADEPWLELAALVDDHGVVIADSDGCCGGRGAAQTPLADAFRLASEGGDRAGQIQSQDEDQASVYGAYPLTLQPGRTGWILVLFNRSDSVDDARADAVQQLRLGASAIALLCFCLWAAMHFGFATRLARLARTVRDFADGRATSISPIPGGDEVHELSVAFAAMAPRLAEREAERVRLEREVAESSENERRRIGQDLHDDIGQQLTAAALATSGLITSLEKAAPSLVPQAERVGSQIRTTIGAVRALSHGLVPVGIDEDGLMRALHELADSTARSAGLRCVFECPQPVRKVPSAAAENLYRIAQEAVNNALKHAAPHEIRIGLELRETGIILEVDDDGEGLRETPPAAGIGLELMRYRAQIAGGSLQIGSAPAGGTRIICQIPHAS